MAFVGEALSPGEGMFNLGIALVAVVLINGSFTFYQEFRAEKAIEALQRMLAFNAVVIREGVEREVPAPDLVPGDLLKLRRGTGAADARLVESYELKVINAVLTGESDPLRRNAEPTDHDLLSAENIVFSGTTVVSGSAKAVIFATGSATEFGRIADLTAEIHETLTPLQKEIAKFIKIISTIAILLGAIFFCTGLLIGNSFWAAFIFAIGIIVANVPEGLLPTVTLTLSIGSQRMARRNALIKSLNSVETLGSTTVICTDKTGTLTQNQMTVRELYANGTTYRVTGEGYRPEGDILELAGTKLARIDSLSMLLEGSALCNAASLVQEGDACSIIGDPTEGALRVLAAKPWTWDSSNRYIGASSKSL
jgi:P-type E1-E2 ATPase